MGRVDRLSDARRVAGAALRPLRAAVGHRNDSFLPGVLWNFSGSTYAIPLASGRMLPQIPAAGLQSKEAVGALPGARLVTNDPQAFPGSHPSVYVVMKVTAQRNIYRVPVQ